MTAAATLASPALTDFNSVVLVVVAVATLVIGLFQWRGRARAAELEGAIRHRKEISDLTYETQAGHAEDLAQVRERLATLEACLPPRDGDSRRPGGEEDPLTYATAAGPSSRKPPAPRRSAYRTA